MLPYALAIAVGLSSSVLFVTAFFLRDIHRRDDFFWSGVGLFYALVLWFCATSITGAVLLGQLAVVALLTAYFWQVIKLRKAIANPEKQNSLDSFSVVGFLQNLFKRSSPKTPESEVPKKEPLTSSKKQVTSPQVTTESPLSEVTTSPKTKTTAENLSDRDKQQGSALKQEPFVTTTTTSNTPEVEKNTLEIPVETSTPSANESTIETTVSPETEIKKLEIKEIAVENVTIVEEETNWDDEVDDIPTSSVKVIEETATSPNDESQTVTSDNSSPEQKNDAVSENIDSSESST